jgi:glutamate-1-semialdehyde 2,1-aminomutase
MIEVTNGASTTSKSPKRMLTTLRSTRAKGNRVWLTDSRQYVDWQAGLRGDIFGYNPKWWQSALVNAMIDGPASSIAHQDERTVAAMLGQFYPDIEAVRFFLNGSDPLAAAVKLARAVTGRDGLLCYGYHGTCSAFAAGPTDFDPDANWLGTMQAERDAYHALEWLGEIPTVNLPIATDKPYLAAVVVECPPTDFQADRVKPWLHALVHAAHAGGALFILDEVVTGFRYGPGGAAGYYDMQDKVDLYCFGKTLGNGIAVSALAGKRYVMQWLAEKPSGGGRVHYSNTFNAEPMGLAAAKATLRQLLDEPPWDHLYDVGGYLMGRWNELGLPWRLAGHPTRPVLEGPGEGLDDLRRHLFRAGHIVVKHPWYVTTATARADVDSLLRAVGRWQCSS